MGSGTRRAAGGCAAPGGARRRERHHALREACTADAERLCSDVDPGGLRVLRCLIENEAYVSEACAGALPQRERG